jgi:hypothetical protein
MYLLHRVTVGWRRHPDRGDTPVPSAIIIAGLAVLALVLVGWVFALASGFMEQVDSQLPDAPVLGD